MGRPEWDGLTVTYRYGTPRGVDLDGEAMRQLRLAHDLRNELVAVEHRYEEVVAAIWAARPELTAAEERASAAQEALAAAAAAVKEAKQRDRSVTPRRELRDEVAHARAEARAAKAELREVKDRLYPAVKEQIFAAARARTGAIRVLYAEYVKGRGLYWATYNDVVDHHRTAVQKMTRRRRSGWSSELRFRRWDGTGSLCVQLQRRAGSPPRSPDLLASDEGPWRNVFQLRPWIDPVDWAELSRAAQRRARVGEAVITFGRKRRLVLPVLVHRPMPADADVTLARVVRRRVGGHYRVTVSVNARLPAPAGVPNGPRVALHTGWRALPDGSLRVAVIAASRRLPAPPAHLHDVLAWHGTWGEVRLPASWREVGKRTDHLRSRRDRALNDLRDELVDWLHEREDPEGDSELPAASEVREWRSPARFARLALDWRDEPPPGGQAIAERLEAWRRRDRHLWEWEANERDQLTGRRRDAWRRAAAWLASVAGTVVVDNVDLETFGRRSDPDESTGERGRRVRANRRLAAPGELRSALRHAAVRRGVPVVTAPARGITRVHQPCDTEVEDRGELTAGTTVWCPTCEERFDQDRNAAVHLLGATVDEETAA